MKKNNIEKVLLKEQKLRRSLILVKFDFKINIIITQAFYAVRKRRKTRRCRSSILNIIDLALHLGIVQSQCFCPNQSI